MLPPTAEQINATKQQIALLAKTISRRNKENVVDERKKLFQLCTLLVINNVSLPSPKEISDLVYESFLKDNPTVLQVGKTVKKQE